MPIVHLNQSPNKGVTISRIYRRTEIIRGLQVRLGIGDLRRGEAETGNFGALGSLR